jgi:hypothetical protein
MSAQPATRSADGALGTPNYVVSTVKLYARSLIQAVHVGEKTYECRGVRFSKAWLQARPLCRSRHGLRRPHSQPRQGVVVSAAVDHSELTLDDGSGALPLGSACMLPGAEP